MDKAALRILNHIEISGKTKRMKEEAENEGTTYYAELNDEGLTSYPRENLLQIMVGDHVVFHISAGSPIATKAHLRINMPQLGEDKHYHKSSVTMNTLKKHPSAKLQQEADEQALVRIEPVVRPFGGIEFEAHFAQPGSFFYQIEYFDTALNMFSMDPGVYLG